ncbi:MAG: hypothetical protein FJ125_07315 [Deltaproteobacteria bacterium]|nr:hypothetical protein [Deltaproteobacteria bacterium]
MVASLAFAPEGGALISTGMSGTWQHGTPAADPTRSLLVHEGAAALRPAAAAAVRRPHPAALGL